MTDGDSFERKGSRAKTDVEMFASSARSLFRWIIKAVNI